MAHIDLMFAFVRAVTQSRPVSPSNTRLTARGAPLPVYLVAGIILPLTDLPPKKIAIKDGLRSISRSAKPRSNGFFEFDRISMLVPLNWAGVSLDGIFCSAFRRVTFLHLLFLVTLIFLTGEPPFSSSHSCKWRTCPPSRPPFRRNKRDDHDIQAACRPLTFSGAVREWRRARS